MKKNAATAAAATVRLYSIDETVMLLSSSRPTINRLIASGILPTVKIGRSVRIAESALFDFINRGGCEKTTEQNLSVGV